MQIAIFFSTFVSLIFFSGCAQLRIDNRVSKEELYALNKTIRELDAKDKQVIYESIQDDISTEKKKGDYAYSLGYIAKAIESYELVNFYEGKNVVNTEVIKQNAQKKAAFHYQESLKYTNNNLKKEIIELNKVMIYNPKYKDSKQRLDNAKNKYLLPLKAIENELHIALGKNDGSIESLKKLSYATQKLRIYEYDNVTVFKVDSVFESSYNRLLQNAIDVFEQGKMKEAEKKFNDLLYVYKNSDEVKQYVEKIKIKKNQTLNIQLAEQALQEGKYKLSIMYAQKVLRVNENDLVAKMLILSAKEDASAKVDMLVKKGKSYYIAKNIDKAKEYFLEALTIDENNNTALAYLKKIQRQLETINSLKDTI